ncbi:sugar phosphate permease [Methylobacterium brachiatum]|uniref:Sugar phosphate permease n=1 Tax=Methylobacterium brachiatum TaxID=269660 RepID=A0AAJ1X0R1_9HYPH|nr:MFS transporter [Methylobacterium brachiatum]MCB4806433.1 MFS transporter [Methylobacterium brachiatum]MDQ0546673.1 sugar phosphate permease [Methylobacterium brachiatum]
MSSGLTLAPVTDLPSRDALYGRLLRRIVPFLLLCYVAAYLDRVNVGFAKLQMLSDLKFSETVYGLGAGVFFVGYALFEVPSNIIMVRFGPRYWIARIMITWGVISAAMMFVTSPTSFYVLRFLLGVAEAGFIPAIIYYLTIWFPSAYRGKASALFLAGIPLSGIVGGPLSGWIMTAFHGATGLQGWQWMFLIEGLLASLLGIVCLFRLDDDAASAAWLTQDEKQQIAADIAAEAREKPLHTARHGLTSGRIWLLSGTYFFFTMGLYGLSFWLPTIIRDSGVKDPLTVGLLTAIPYTGALATMYIVGLSSDRQRERRWHLAVPALVGAAGLIASVLVAHSPAMALAALTVASAGTLTCIPQFYTLAPSVLTGAAAATGLAVANSVGSVAGFVSPYLLGWVKDATGSTGQGVMVLGATLVVGALLVFINPARLVNR